MDRRDRQLLVPALAASFAIHVALVVGALFLANAAPAAQQIDVRFLAVHLVKKDTAGAVSISPPPKAMVAPAPTLASVTSTGVARPTASVQPDQQPTAMRPADIVASPTADAAAGITPGGRVEVEPTGVLALIGDDLTARSHSEFPGEVDEPTQLVSELAPIYPQAAIEARREGSVVAWVVIGTSGGVEEFVIADGDEEFAEPVRAVLADAQFSPAKNNGETIRFFTILKFNFRIGETTAKVISASVLPQLAALAASYPITGI